MRRIRKPLLALAMGLLWGSVASAQPSGPAMSLTTASIEGAEFVMIDESGSRILGRGTARDGLLQMTVGESVGDFLLLVILPDGEVVRLVGREWLGGSLRITLGDGEQVALDDLAEGLGLRFRLERLDGEQDGSSPRDPDDGDDDDDGNGGGQDPDDDDDDGPGDDDEDDDDRDDDGDDGDDSDDDDDD